MPPHVKINDAGRETKTKEKVEVNRKIIAAYQCAKEVGSK